MAMIIGPDKLRMAFFGSPVRITTPCGPTVELVPFASVKKKVLIAVQLIRA